MSDNIDYDELDKAVNEAIQTRAKVRPPQRTVVKNTTVKRPPRRQGQYIDFVAKRPLSPAKKQSTAKKTPVAQRPVVKRVMRPQPQKAPTAVVRPLPSRHTTIAATPKRPVAPKKVVTKPAPAAPKPTPKPAPEPAPAPAAPNANNYSLGGRSPFIVDTKVDKRPLGTNIPETSARTVRSTRNTYSQKDPSTTSTHKSKAKKHVITESPKKHSGWLWALAVLLIIAAGAGLGYLAYVLVFQN